MALDNDDTVRTAATAIDVSAGTSQTITPVTANPNRIAWPNFPRGLHLVGVVTVASAATDMVSMTGYFEYTTDAGTTWHRGGLVEFICGGAGVAIPLQKKSGPVGPLDISPEQEAAGQVRWRVVVEWDSSVSASDPTIQFFLAGEQHDEAVKDAE
jgi:hypothetical protein